MMTVTNLQHDIYVVLALLLDSILWGKIPSSLLHYGSDSFLIGEKPGIHRLVCFVDKFLHIHWRTFFLVLQEHKSFSCQLIQKICN